MKQTKTELTQKEKEVYNYIVSFKIVNGFAPTITEISKGLYTSRTYVRECLEKLQEKEVLKYVPSKARTIVVQKMII